MYKYKNIESFMKDKIHNDDYLLMKILGYQLFTDDNNIITYENRIRPVNVISMV